MDEYTELALAAERAAVGRVLLVRALLHDELENALWE